LGEVVFEVVFEVEEVGLRRILEGSALEKRGDVRDEDL
jgi:hypothetical protein